MAAEIETPSAYVNHHMTHLTVGHGFWTWHIDTIVMSAVLALLVGLVLWLAAARSARWDAQPSGLGASSSSGYTTGSMVKSRPSITATAAS